MRKIFLFASIFLMGISSNAQDLADLFETLKNSVVTIYVSESVNTGEGDPRVFTSNMGLGSGVLINDDIILTASHVVANAEAIMVQFFNGESIQAQTIRISRAADVAVIKLSKTPSSAVVAKLGNSEETRIGEEVFVVGAPMGLPYSLSRGVISGRHKEENHVIDGAVMEFFQTDAAINTGNSGGPMFNYKGEVVGIVSSILSRSGGFEGIGFAATTNVAKSLLRSRSSVYFGTESTILPYEFARILNVPQESGLLVEHVVQDSPAGKIGLVGGFRKVSIEGKEILLGGDIILSVDDVKITGMDSFYELMKYMDSITDTHTYHLRVLRAGEIRDFHWVNAVF